MMTKDFKDLLRAFNAHAVQYLIIGGHAFSVHAEPRTTKDLDLFIRSDPENARAAFRALAQFGAPLQDLTEADFIDGITFDEAWPNRIVGDIDGEVPAPVISRGDLIRNKLASGREQDLLDVKVLRAVEKAVKNVVRKNQEP